MKRATLIIIFCNLILTPVSSFATSETRVERLLFQLADELPDDMVYQGRPIDAACIQAMIGTQATEPIALSACMQKLKQEKIARVFDQERLEEKYIGYDTNEESNYYQWLADLKNHQHLIYAEYSASGGVFSELVIMERHEDQIHKVTVIAGGDREARGIHHFSYKNGKLNWSQYFTPDDVVKLGLSLSGVSQNDNECEDLEYCPLCGVAVANFETTDFQNRNFLNLQFTSDEIDISEIQTLKEKADKTIQDCFDIVKMQYIESGKTKLNEEQLKRFMDEVMTFFRSQEKTE